VFGSSNRCCQAARDMICSRRFGAEPEEWLPASTGRPGTEVVQAASIAATPNNAGAARQLRR
jgi:hypothetical protein